MKTREEILQMVENEDVEFIRLQFTDMFGTLKNVAVTATQLQYMKDNRYLIDGSCMYGELRTGEEDMYLCPDLDTFVILPWRPQQGKVARLLCDVCRADGTPLAVSPREILKKTIEKVEKEGYTFQIDPECEFFLFHEDENGVPTTVTHEKAGYLDISPLDLGENARRDMVMTLEDMGFEIESSHHEKAPGQHEIDFRYAGAMETADRIVTFKTAVRSIAKRFGLYATFMPKPKAGTAGSGMHINISLFQNGKNIFSDPEAEDGLSQEAKWFMGGIMAHVKGMCAVTNPLVNSYKRLTSGCDAPRDIIWTTKNHNTLLRIPFMRGEDTRIELRFPDPSANAYLTIALCMAAGLDGIAKHLDPGAESARLFASRTEAEKAAAGIDHLPDTLREAVAFMEEDSFVKMVLGQEFVDLYVEAKKAEWNEYMSQVSEWEVDKYLHRTYRRDRMSSIIIVLPKLEDAKHIKDILARRGLTAAALCTTASMALSQVHQLDSGVVICSYRIRDMHYTQLAEYLPDYFDMLLLASTSELESAPHDMVTLTYPIRPNDLASTVEMMLTQLDRRLKKRKSQPKKRTEQEQNYINNAKWLLMERNHMTEQEAFRYIQKSSMDSGTNMVETAQMILLLIYDG